MAICTTNKGTLRQKIETIMGEHVTAMFRDVRNNTAVSADVT